MMKLAYIDSSVWIIRAEGIPEYKKIIERHLDQLVQDGWFFCLSEVVKMEVLFKPYRDNNIELIHHYIRLFEQATYFKNYINLFEDARLIMQQEYKKTIDSIHIAFAVHYGCNCIVTTDAHLQNLKKIDTQLINLSSTIKE